MSTYLIIGAGISGCTAADELAKQGHDVELIESSNRIGGAVLDYTCKATDECSRCGVCVAHTRIYDAIKHPSVHVSVGTSIQSVSHNGTLQIHLSRKNPSIAYHACVSCDRCIEACPEGAISKTQRAELTQYVVDFEKCRLPQGKSCSLCADACPEQAIFAQAAVTNTTVTGDAALIATGHEPYNAKKKIRLGYGRFENVMTGVEAEELLNRQPYLRNPSDNIAFIQCVGSRDPRIGRNYCSSVCCAYALRLARIIKHRHPETPVTIYYIDIQHFDKTFTLFRKSVEESGVQFVRGIPSQIEHTRSGRVRLHIESQDGDNSLVEHDLVVLSVGMGPAAESQRIASFFGLQQDEFGFFSSSLPDVFVSGTCTEPLSIPDSMAAARGSAFDMLHGTGGKGNTTSEDAGDTYPRRPRREQASEDAGGTSGFEKKQIPLEQRVLVIGGGTAGTYVAEEVHRFGYSTVVIEQAEQLGGLIASYCSEQTKQETLSTRKLLRSVINGISGLDVLTNSSLIELTGNIGNFSAHIRTPEGEKTERCGAVVVASGKCFPAEIHPSPHILSLFDMNLAIADLVKRKGVRFIGLILDMELDESKASMEMVFELAQQIQQKKRYQVSLFCHDVRVASKDLEIRYDEIREAGVNLIKYEGTLSLDETEKGVVIRYTDGILHQSMEVYCDRIGVSPYGLPVLPDKQLIERTKLSIDAYNQIQDNNIHLFPEQTNRPGIFTVGSCRGQHYTPQMITEAKATALEIHNLLSQKTLEVELSNAIVDEDKCVLCLTCIRSCPHKAMQVNQEKGTAESVPEACQKCGICAGECPAKAIELPVYSDRVILKQVV